MEQQKTSTEATDTEQPNREHGCAGTASLDTDGTGSFSFTLTAKLRHGLLWAAVKRLGSQAALARELGVTPTAVGQWVNLKGKPPFNSPRWPEIEAKLFVITGKTADELFPEALMSKDFLDAPKEFEQTKEVELRAIACATRNRLELPSPEEDAIREELKEKVGEVLATLNFRQRTVLEMRFGIPDGRTHTLAEVGRAIGVTRERVREIEQKAIRELSKPRRRRVIEDFASV